MILRPIVLKLAAGRVTRGLKQLRPTSLRAALWTVSACRAVHSCDGGVMRGPALPEAPQGPVSAAGVVHLVLRARGEQCLVRSYVRQAWLAAHGDQRELVIGTTGVDGFAAHAWLSGEDDTEGVGFQELMRLPAPGMDG